MSNPKAIHVEFASRLMELLEDAPEGFQYKVSYGYPENNEEDHTALLVKCNSHYVKLFMKNIFNSELKKVVLESFIENQLND